MIVVGVAECLAQAQMGPKLVSVVWNSGVSAVEGFECIEVYGDTVLTFRMSVIISQVSAVEGCPLSGVPL